MSSPAPVGWKTPLLLGLGLFLFYLANGRAITAGDVVPATLGEIQTPSGGPTPADPEEEFGAGLAD